MSLTLSDAIAEVRSNVNESTAVFWSDPEITDWIQEGCRIFSSKTLMVEDTQDLDPLKESTLAYSSSDETWIGEMIEPYAAIYFDGTATYKGIMKIHPRQIGNVALATAGPPKYYSMHDRMLYIFPMTSAAVVAAGASISFLFAKITSDITELTDEYQHLPIVYATAKAKQKDQKFAESAALMSQFFQEISFEREDKHSREVDSLDKFKIPVRGGGNESAQG
jgi:hypothetical protein